MCAIKVIKSTDKPNDEKETRPASALSFPSFDLEQSIKVAQVINDRGGGECSPEQLAGWLDYSSTRNGTYLMRFYAAKYFGLIESSRSVINVSDRARAILAPVMPEDSTNAKVEAFLSIPLFARIYEHFKGKALPPDVGLKNLFHGTYKIPTHRTTLALRMFRNSAEQAGFFSINADRLILPAGAQSERKAAVAPSKDEPSPQPEKQIRSGGGGGDGTGGVHSAIIGLLRELPAPGSPWPGKKRFKEAFMATLDFIYPEEKTP